VITELALLHLQPGSKVAFEAAFGESAHLLQRADGYLGHRLMPTLDDQDLYLLEVTWRDLAAHVEGFEPSNDHARFVAALVPLLLRDVVVAHVPCREGWAKEDDIASLGITPGDAKPCSHYSLSSRLRSSSR
jgi:heme-degrading monooxygenase HmoA